MMHQDKYEQRERNLLLAKRAMVEGYLDLAGSRFVSITFRKKDNSLRTMTTCNTCTVDLVGDDASDSRKQAVEQSKINNPHLIRRYDIHAAGWRTINMDTITAMAVDGETLEF